MNMYSIARNQFNASAIALLTILSLLLSALPAAFFVAEAAVQNVTIGVSMVPNPSVAPDTITLSNPENFSVTIEDLVINDSTSTVLGSQDVTIAGNDSVTLSVSNRLNNSGDTITFGGTNITATSPITYSDTVAIDAAVAGSFTITADDGVVPPLVLSSGPVRNVQDNLFFATLQEAINANTTGTGETIELTANLSTTAQVTVNKSITIDGNGFTISPTFARTGNDNNAAIGVIGTANVTITDLTINGSGGTNLHGVNVFNATDVLLENITINNNDYSAVNIAGSEVVIDTISTSGNGTGNNFNVINAAKGSPTDQETALTIQGDSSHTEDSAVKLHIVVSTNNTTNLTDVENQYENVTNAVNAFLGTISQPPLPANTQAYTLKTVTVAPPTVTIPPCSTNNSTFDTFTLGSVNNQFGWGVTNTNIDQQIVNNTLGISTFGCKSLRISNAFTSGSFGDQTFSYSVANEAGEASAQGGGLSGGDRKTRFEASWDFASADPTGVQSGLSVVASPDRGDGARMSWIRMSDAPGGLAIDFYEYKVGAPNTGGGNGFVLTNIASGLDRTKPHTVKVVMDFVDGSENDVVKVYVNGDLKYTGTSWEDYFRVAENNPTRTVDSLLFRVSGAAASATQGKGFLIDNVEISTSDTPVVPPPAPRTPPTVTLDTPTPAENAVVRGVVSGRALATDDFGMGSYYLRFWKDVFEVAGGGTLVKGCQEAPGADLLGKTLDKSCEFDTTTSPDGVYFFSAQFLDSDNTWGQALRRFLVDNTAPAVPTGLKWTGSDAVLVPNNGTTSLLAGTAAWQPNTEADFSHYLYKYWNNIPSSQYNNFGAAWVNRSNGISNTSLPGVFNQGEGTHYFCIVAVDTAGNESACSSTFTINYSTAIPTATVTMCKVNQYTEPQTGWRLALLGDVVDTVQVLPTGATFSSDELTPGSYVVKAEGTYVYRTGPDMIADAAFSLRRANEFTSTAFVNGLWLPSTYWGASSWLSLQMNTTPHSFGTIFSPNHTYFAPLTVSTPSNANFILTDTGYGDNSGTITATVYEGFTGVTGSNGCVTIENVPYGSYVVDEQMQLGWLSTSGLGTFVVDSPTETVTVVNNDQSIIEGCTDPDAGNFNSAATRDDGSCTLAIPTHLSPANGTTTTSNDFFFDWTDVVGAVSYEVQFSQSNAVGSDGSLTSGVWQGDFQGIQPTASQARSVGASGTWYWQVRTVDSKGVKGVWTTPWMVTINTAPVVVITPPVVITPTTTPTTTVPDVPPSTTPTTTPTSTTPVVPVVPPTTTNRSGGSSGTRVDLSVATPQPLVLGATTGQCGMLLTDYLSMGINNNPLQVKLLQLFLIGQGYFSVQVTGVFDGATDAAVRAFQEKYRADILDPWVTAGILQISNPTGRVYQLTRYKINNMVCPGSEPMPSLI